LGGEEEDGAEECDARGFGGCAGGAEEGGGGKGGWGGVESFLWYGGGRVKVKDITSVEYRRWIRHNSGIHV
jgi:hypothetical protein